MTSFRLRAFARLLRSPALMAAALTAFCGFAPPAPAAAADEAAPVEIRPGRQSGRPTPRFESLRNADANLRVGPSERYKILWVYHRRGMPVEVYDEYDVWRRVRDAYGDTGWLHHSQISLARTAMVMQATELRAAPDATSAVLAKAEPTVVLNLVECRAEFCRVEAQGLQGWTPKSAIWGVRADETF